MKEKICRICKKEKSIECFSKRSNGSRDGYSKKCKECHNEYMRDWVARHPFDYKRFYNVQKGDAKRRGVAFLLSFDEWFNIWEKSGHLDERGAFSGQYCMARFGDRGAYEMGNVRICTVNENHSEMIQKESSRQLLRGNKHALGLKHSKETRDRISESLRMRHLRKKQAQQ
jgi:hypothetical protein